MSSFSAIIKQNTSRSVIYKLNEDPYNSGMAIYGNIASSIRRVKMSAINCIGSGLVYKNEIPHIYSRHAAHPSIAVLKNNEILVTTVIGQAFESADTRAYLFRSSDEGGTWTPEGLLFNETSESESDLGRISVAPNGDLVAVYFKHNRSRKDQGYTNPENMGFTETEIYLTKSFENRGLSNRH